MGAELRTVGQRNSETITPWIFIPPPSSGLWQVFTFFCFSAVIESRCSLTSSWYFSYVSSWPCKHGRFCSRTFWWTERCILPNPSWWPRKTWGGRLWRGLGRCLQVHPWSDCGCWERRKKKKRRGWVWLKGDILTHLKCDCILTLKVCKAITLQRQRNC